VTAGRLLGKRRRAGGTFFTLFASSSRLFRICPAFFTRAGRNIAISSARYYVFVERTAQFRQHIPVEDSQKTQKNRRSKALFPIINKFKISATFS
jgi:hypothetical protein